MSITDCKQAKKIIQTATEYILGMTIELERRSIEKDPAQVKRNLELSAYFTKPQMELPHRQIALMAAMKVAYTKKNFLSAANFASRVLANNSSGKNAETVGSIILDAHSRLLMRFCRRLEKSKFMVNAMLMTLSRLSMILLRSLKFALHLSLPFIPEVP